MLVACGGGDGTGGSGGGGGAGGTGGAPECVNALDCVVPAPECRKLIGCFAGTCAYEDAPEGQPLSTQALGDCADTVCDGKGDTKAIPAPDDVPLDASECTVHTCDGTTPVETVLPSIPCYTGPAGTEGVGACKPGTMACSADGKPEGACEGEVLPTRETCGVDADCDGEPGPACVCGDGFVSGGEGCDDGNTSDGDPCSAACVAQETLMISSHGEHTCALLSGGVVKCWGANGAGQLGLGSASNNQGDQAGEMGAALPAVSLGAGKKAVSVAAGYSHACAILEDGGVKCWGVNDVGQLGYGDKETRGNAVGEMGDNLPVVDLGAGSKAVEISLGFNHTCALLDSGDMKCWGANFYGQLGYGDVEQRGDEPGEMGDNLAVVDLGAGKKVAHIAAGFSHTCALLSDGALKCWGNGAAGELGTGEQASLGDALGEMGDNLPVVDLGAGKVVLEIEAGAQHGCALLEGGAVKCWGTNIYGQLGYGDTEVRGDGPGEMGENLLAVDLGPGETAQHIAVGHTFSCAVLGDATVKCWGYNHVGQLGQGDTVTRGDGAGEMGDALLPISLGAGAEAAAIAAGGNHACVTLKTGALRCWGYNNLGALGQENGMNRGDGPGEMGDVLPATRLFSAAW